MPSIWYTKVRTKYLSSLLDVDSYPILNFDTLRLLIPDDQKYAETGTTSEKNCSETLKTNSNEQVIDEDHNIENTQKSAGR